MNEAPGPSEGRLAGGVVTFEQQGGTGWDLPERRLRKREGAIRVT